MTGGLPAGNRPTDPYQPWFRRHRAAHRPRLRLVCFPHAGGTAGFFRSWAEWLPDDTELLAVCYPGRETRIGEACLDNMGDLAGEIADALVPLCREPLVFLGHSMGACVAYEVALRLQVLHHRTPDVLFVSSHKAPHRAAGSGLHRRGDTALIDHIVRLGHTDPTLFDDPELRELVMPALRADHRLLDTYAPDPSARINCPVVACVGDRDPEVAATDMTAWAEATRGAFALRTYPGDHFYLAHHSRELVMEVMRQAKAEMPSQPRVAVPTRPY